MSESKRAFSDNAAGALAYITVFPAIAFLVLLPYRKSAYVRFHAWQSVYLNLLAVIVYYGLSFLAGWLKPTKAFFAASSFWVILLIWVLLWSFGAIRALNGTRFKFPILGTLADRQSGE
ncbi:MAG: hypothetical protein WB424_13235 [Terracidiphilus sp.]